MSAQSPGGKTWANLKVGDWADEAACVGHNAELWFPSEPGNPHRRREVYGPATARAIRICKSCPVIEQCLSHALEHEERFGVWGGTTPQDRGHGPGQPPPLSVPMSPADHGTEAGLKQHKRRNEQPCSLCSAGAALAARERKARRRKAARSER